MGHPFTTIGARRLSHRVTITEAVKLSGRSRRSLYRDMGAGRLAYHAGHDGRRLVDVSELIRAYGALPGMVEEESAPASEGEGLSARLLAELVELTRKQGETLEAQREELAELRREVAELRTLPAPGSLAPHPDDRHDTPAPAEAQATPPAGQGAPKEAGEDHQGRPRDFDDIFARFEARTRH